LTSFASLHRSAPGIYVVVGLGASRELARDLIHRGAFSIGCNEAQAALGVTMDFGLSADRWSHQGGAVCPFSPERLEALRLSRPRGAYFHSIPDSVPAVWPEWRGKLVPFGHQGPPHGSLSLEDVHDRLLPNGWSSVVPAIAAAWWLGASRIGVCGMDLTDRSHSLWPHRVELSKILAAHSEIYRAAGCPVVNLSETSIVRGLEVVSPLRFWRDPVL
jgi:hypothetical protein